MSDLIERLSYYVADDAFGPRRKAMREAAAEIRRLIAENEALRTALTEIASQHIGEEIDDAGEPGDYEEGFYILVMRARAALSAQQGDGEP